MPDVDYEAMTTQELRDLRDVLLAALRAETGLVLVGQLLPPELNRILDYRLRKGL